MFLATKKRSKAKKVESTKQTIKLSTIYFALAILVPFAILILRDRSVGLDYNVYINLYNRFFTNSLLATDILWIGFGYAFLTKICVFIFGSHYHVFFGIVGFVTIYCFFKTIYEESTAPWMSLLLLFSFCLYYQMFNQFRQMLAIAITFYGFKYIKNRDLKKYIVTIFLAFSIHKSAIIMLPCYWIGNLKLQRKSILFYVFLSILIYFLYDSIESIFLQTSYGQTYLLNAYFDVVEKSSLFNLFFRVALFVFCYYLTKRSQKNTREITLLRNLCFICILFQIMTIKSYVFGRITTYFFVYFILLIPLAINQIKMNKSGRILVFAAFIVICLAYHYIYYVTKASSGFGIGIYHFFFTNLNY